MYMSYDEFQSIGFAEFYLPRSDFVEMNASLENEKTLALLSGDLDALSPSIAHEWRMWGIADMVGDTRLLPIDVWDVQQIKNFLLIRNVRKMAAPKVRLALEMGADPNSKLLYCGVKFPPLYIAAELDYATIMKLLIDYGADVNYTTPNGSTPLINASDEGNYDAVRLLVESGAFVNARNDWGVTPLSAAQNHHHEDVADYLRQRGAMR